MTTVNHGIAILLNKVFSGFETAIEESNTQINKSKKDKAFIDTVIFKKLNQLKKNDEEKQQESCQ